ncbi:MAG: hypothetical protein R6X13_04200 [bacterium]
MLELHWQQWSALGVAAQVAPEERWVLDLEALLVSTGALALADRRLTAGAREWLVQNREWVNHSRLARVEREFARAGLVTSVADAAGGHASRKVARPALHSPALAQLRLRALFGVDARAELCLWLSRNRAGTAGGIARAIRFDQKTVYRTLQKWSAAGIVADVGDGWQFAPGWRERLSSSTERCAHMDWVNAFIALGLVLKALSEAGTNDRYLLSSRFRDARPAAVRAARDAGVTIPDPGSYPGESYAEPFAEGAMRLMDALLEQG